MNTSEAVSVLSKPCPLCSKRSTLHMTIKQYTELLSPERRLVQQILPEYTAEQREIAMNGMCSACQSVMFGGDDA